MTKRVRKAQWRHWEITLAQADQGNIGRILAVVSWKKSVTGLPVIQDACTVQGKCEVLRETFFPTNVVTPSLLPANWLPDLISETSDRFVPVSSTEMAKAVSSCRLDSAMGTDGISYTMVSGIQRAART